DATRTAAGKVENALAAKLPELIGGDADLGVSTNTGLKDGGNFDGQTGAGRLAALNELPVIFVWTHDSIGLGEDGPTHQPVEHLMSLRAMPGLTLIRP